MVPQTSVKELACFPHIRLLTSRHVRKSHQIIIIDNIHAKKGRNCMKNGKKHRSIWREMYATQYVNKWIPSWERTIMTISALYQTNTLQRDCYIAQESALSLHSDILNRPLICHLILTKINCITLKIRSKADFKSKSQNIWQQIILLSSTIMQMICALHKIWTLSGRLSLMRNVQLMKIYIYIYSVCTT